jgi:hypothetical protein
MREKQRTCSRVIPWSLFRFGIFWIRKACYGTGTSRSALIYCTRTLSALENVRLANAISCVGNVVENLSLIRSRSNVVVERRGTVSLGQFPEHRGCCRKLLQTITELCVIQGRFIKEILFFVWINEGALVVRLCCQLISSPKWRTEVRGTSLAVIGPAGIDCPGELVNRFFAKHPYISEAKPRRKACETLLWSGAG